VSGVENELFGIFAMDKMRFDVNELDLEFEEGGDLFRAN